MLSHCRLYDVAHFHDGQPILNFWLSLLFRLEFDNQKSRLSNQYEYEESLDTYQNVRKWKEMISSDEENIKVHKQEEKKAMKVISSTIMWSIQIR